MRFHLWCALLVNSAGLASGIAAQAQTVVPTHVQTKVPERELSAPDAKSAEHFGTILNVRPLVNGGVLVNDGQHRQLVALDATLNRRTVIIDSVAVGGQSYGATAAPLIPYLGDSSLFVDNASLSLLVIDASGKIVRVMAAARPSDLRMLGTSASGVDTKGNLIYRRPTVALAVPPPSDNSGKTTIVEAKQLDSTSIVRANFDTRTLDTLIQIKTTTGTRGRLVTSHGRSVNTMYANPLPTVDDWAVLSDGSLTVVRGHDYHVDVVRQDGTVLVGDQLPFDWKKLSDADKQQLIDSARAVQETRDSISRASDASRARPVSLASDAPMAQTYLLVHDFVPLKEIPDYWPPIRTGAARADLDAQLWILPTTSAQSKNGELVYDVVNNRGELAQRVRVPAGRSIAGFGHNGIVYLMQRDSAGWTLERTHVLN